MIVLTQTSGTEADKLLMLGVMLAMLAFGILGWWAWRQFFRCDRRPTHVTAPSGRTYDVTHFQVLRPERPL